MVQPGYKIHDRVSSRIHAVGDECLLRYCVLPRLELSGTRDHRSNQKLIFLNTLQVIVSEIILIASDSVYSSMRCVMSLPDAPFFLVKGSSQHLHMLRPHRIESAGKSRYRKQRTVVSSYRYSSDDHFIQANARQPKTSRVEAPSVAVEAASRVDNMWPFQTRKLVNQRLSCRWSRESSFPLLFGLSCQR